ncbi:MAG: hypothetical protein WC992_00420 [Acholeplasmataceae bacterium]|jgi:hypothetical protein
MKWISVSLLVVLVLLVSVPGCAPNTRLTPEQVRLASYGTTYAASYAGTYLLLKNEAVSPLDILKMVTIITEDILPLTAQLESGEDLYVVFYPVAEQRLLLKVRDERLRGIALGLVSQGLRVGENYLNENPDITAKRDMCVAVLNAVLSGIADGCRDVALPYTSEARNRQVLLRGPV